MLNESKQINPRFQGEICSKAQYWRDFCVCSLCVRACVCVYVDSNVSLIIYFNKLIIIVHNVYILIQ